MYTLGIDLSTQSITLSILNYQTQKNELNISVAFREIIESSRSLMDRKTLLIKTNIEGKAEQDISIFLTSLEKSFYQLKNKCDINKIKAIQISAQQHGHIYVNESFINALKKLKNKKYTNDSLSEIMKHCYSYPYSPIWRTSNTEKQAKEIRKKAGGKKNIIKITGSDIPLRFTGAVIKKLFDDDETLYNNTYKILLLNTFICSVLTANENTPLDFGNASGTGLMDYETKHWDNKIISLFPEGFKSKLSEIESPIHKAGNISSYFAEKYGFNKNCVVGIGTGDNPATKVIAKGNILSLGTSFVYMIETNEKQRDLTGSANSMYDGFAKPFMIFCRTNGGMLWDNIMKSYNKTYKCVTKALIENNSNFPLILWQEEEETFPKSKILNTKRYYKDVCFENDYKGIVLSSLGLMEAYSRKLSKPKLIYVTGGPSKDEEILKIVAGIWQCNIKILPNGGAALGAALSAVKLIHKNVKNIDIDEIREKLTASKTIEPNDKKEKQYEKYKKILIEKFNSIIKK